MEQHIDEIFRKPCPCDNCYYRDKCGDELLACRQFSMYVNTGRVVYGNKEPDEKTWHKIFFEEAEELAMEGAQL
jgi:hypothetical protein